LFLGLFAQIQSVPFWRIDSLSKLQPPSVELQRWALGLGQSTQLNCDFDAIEPEYRQLALSVEPLSTQGASSSLFLCALIVWGAGALWGHRKSYPQLLIALLILGLLVGAYGLVGVFLRNQPNLLGLKYGASFSVFVSKNSAGAFLNIVLASAIGLAVWRGQKLSSHIWRQMGSRDMRQWPWNAKFQYGLKITFEKIAALDIASVLAVLFLAFCVAISLCRGAFVCAIVAVFVSVAIAWPGKKRNAMIFGCFVAMLITVVAMASLQLDPTALNRIESIESIDLDTEKQSGRLYIWGVATQAARHYGWLGSGLGTFHVASLPFQSPSTRGWYYHAESLVIEIAVTLGYLGSIVTLLALTLSVYALFRIYHSERFRDYLPLQVAGAFFLASQALHACIDFAWILPGIYVPSSLLLGAILGGQRESQRAFRRIHLQEQASHDRKGSELWRFGGLAFATVCLVFLMSNQRSVSVLALAETMEKKIQTDSPPDTSSSDRAASYPMVDQWIDQCVDSYSEGKIDAIYRSPILLRLLADAIAYDARVERWQQRPLAASSQLAWNQTRPLVTRLALDSCQPSDRPTILESVGGRGTLDRFERSNYWYIRGQLLSPLDWRLVWGRISTALHCSPEQLKPLLSVLAKTSAHSPSNLTSGSLIYHSVLSDQEKLELWKQAIRANRAESIPIAEIMAKSYKDGEIPIETFPEDPQVLRKLYNVTFNFKEFPATHEQLAERLVQASLKSKWTGLRKATWMADIARETGKAELEIENLTIILGLDRSNVAHLKRIIALLIDAKEKDKAGGFLRQLVRAAPSDPEIEAFNKQIAGLEP
jgi:hypothetical protein